MKMMQAASVGDTHKMIKTPTSDGIKRMMILNRSKAPWKFPIVGDAIKRIKSAQSKGKAIIIIKLTISEARRK